MNLLRLNYILWVMLVISSATFAQKPIWNFDDFQKRVFQNNDTLYVVNFWATWCKPCVAELPYFENQRTEFSSLPVRIILISLDFKKDMERMSEFALKKDLKSEIVLLSAGNPDVWIDRISPQWSGAIPATAFFKNNKLVHFYEGEFTNEELKTTINNQMK
jgi:thiol-disulfide isomerase/thioredoxin